MLDLTASLKRIAWAYGCSKKGSEEEAQLELLLAAKVLRTLPQPEPIPLNLQTGDSFDR